MLSAEKRGQSVARINKYGRVLDVSEPENILAEILTDARHFADANDLDFGYIDKQAYSTYSDELNWPVKTR